MQPFHDTQENDRRTANRGLEVILDSILLEPQESEEVRSAAAIPAIIKILADLPECKQRLKSA